MGSSESYSILELIFLPSKKHTLLSYAPGPMSHPLYLRGGVCKPLDMRQIGTTDLTLPLSGAPSGEERKGIAREAREYPEGGRAYDTNFPRTPIKKDRRQSVGKQVSPAGERIEPDSQERSPALIVIDRKTASIQASCNTSWSYRASLTEARHLPARHRQ